MTYLFLILFFMSLSAIIFMIGKKLSRLQQDQVHNHEEVLIEIPYIEDVKRMTAENARKFARAVLIFSLRFYIKSNNFFKQRYKKIKAKIKEMSRKKGANGEPKEMSKFLKVVGDYKRKIKEIKHRIKKEEDL